MLRILAAAALVAAAPPVPHSAQPTGKWVVEFADHQCLASRAYQVQGEEFALALRPKPASDHATLWLRTAGRDLRDAKVWAGGLPLESLGLRVRNVEPSGRRMFTISLTAEERARLISSGQVRVAKGRWAADFVVPSAGPLFKTLDACTADLLKRWGLSREAQAGIAAYPELVKRPFDYVSPADYPTSALKGSTARLR